MPRPRAFTALLSRYGLLVPLLAGALLLAVAELSTLYEIRAITAVPEGGTKQAGPHHGYALAIVAAAVVPMSIGAVVGGSRPAALALVVLGLIALAITLLVDLPDVNETGLIGRTYDRAEATPQEGLYIEALGAALVLVGAVATLLLRPGAEPRRRSRAAATDAASPQGPAGATG